jgi:hypothetical protein
MKCPKYSCFFIDTLNESLKMLMETPIGGVNQIGMCRGDTIIESIKLKEAREFYETNHCNKNYKICPAFKLEKP